MLMVGIVVCWTAGSSVLLLVVDFGRGGNGRCDSVPVVVIVWRWW